MAKRRQVTPRAMGPIKAIQRQPTMSLWLMFGGALLGLLVAKAVPAVRSIFGLAAYIQGPRRFRCPMTGRVITRDLCENCGRRWECKDYIKDLNQ
jgi:hypothetical protein